MTTTTQHAILYDTDIVDAYLLDEDLVYAINIFKGVCLKYSRMSKLLEVITLDELVADFNESGINPYPSTMAWSMFKLAFIYG